jgi:hypothetical protein
VADQDGPPVGSVAEEAARLLDALGDWGAGAAQAAAGHAHRHTADDDAPASAPHCPTCGAENGAGQAVVCQLCPVCQGLGMLRSVRPETVDRLADLAGAIAATLRDLAAQRRETASAPGEARPTRVQEIAVEDEQGSVAP